MPVKNKGKKAAKASSTSANGQAFASTSTAITDFVPASSPPNKKGKGPAKIGRPRKNQAGAGSSDNHVPFAPTPSRSSLRQTIAASIKEAQSGSDADGPSSSKNNSLRVMLPLRSGHRKKGGNGGQKKSNGKRAVVVDDDDSDEFDDSSSSDDELDLLNTSDEDESMLDEDDRAIERAEERELRREFEQKQRKQTQKTGQAPDGGAGGTAQDEEGEVSDFSEGEEEEWEQRKRSWREDAKKEADADSDATLTDDTERAGRSKEYPAKGGDGVVTWSDYEFFETSDSSEDEAPGRSGTNSFDKELAELLAISESVVGPSSRSYQYAANESDGSDADDDVSEMWFEHFDGTDSIDGDDEGGSVDGDDEGGQQLVLLERFKRSGSATSSSSGDGSSYALDNDSEFSSSDDDEDGDTTDSMGSDDEPGLRPFGIEVLSDKEIESWAEDGEGEPMPQMGGEDSELVVLMPRYDDTFAGEETTRTTLREIQENPTKAIRAIAQELGVGQGVAARIFARLNLMAFHTTRARSKRDAAPSRETSTSSAQEPAKEVPPMGTFTPEGKLRRQAKSFFVDQHSGMPPTPYGRERETKRKRSLLELSSGLTRLSKSSGFTKASTSDSSATSLPSPFAAVDAADFELDDLLDFSLLFAEMSDEGVSEEDRVVKRPRTNEPDTNQGLSDLSRWTRVPMGAFRSKIAAAFPPAVQYLAQGGGSSQVNGANARGGAVGGRAPTLNLFTASRQRSNTAPVPKQESFSEFLSSPPVLVPQKRRALSNAGDASGPRSRKARRKAKQALASSTRTNEISPGKLLNGQSSSTAGGSGETKPNVASSSGHLSVSQTANMPPVNSPFFRSVVGGDYSHMPEFVL